MKKQIFLIALVGLTSGSFLANKQDRILRGSDIERKTRKERAVKTSEERLELKPMQKIRRKDRSKKHGINSKINKDDVMKQMHELHPEKGPKREERTRSLLAAAKNPRIKEHLTRLRGKANTSRV